MYPKPTDVLTRIKNGSLLPKIIISTLQHDEILDERDSNAGFEAQWMRCYNLIEEKWQPANIKQELITLKDDVRRESFLSVSLATNQHEIASYVSDDFDLIIRGILLGINDEFLNSLWEAYNQNEIPTPQKK